MRMQERAPHLSSWPGGAYLPHVFLNGAFAHMNAQLEEFATDPFCSSPCARKWHGTGLAVDHSEKAPAADLDWTHA